MGKRRKDESPLFSNLILRREWHVIGLEGRKEDYTLVTHMS